MITEAEHRTNIIPLRWFANFCNHIGTPSILYLFDFQDEGITSGIRWRYHHFMWKWTYAIYNKWGTIHKVISWDMTEDIDKDEF